MATVFVAGCSNSDSGKPIELGHVHSSNADDTEYKALKLAVEELNRDPGELPLGRRLQIRHAPGGATPEEWGAQATRLVALNKVHGLIAADRSAFAERVGLAIQGENLIAVSPAGWPGSQNLFAVGLAPAERGRVLAIDVKSDPTTHSTGVLVLRDPAARSANLAADRFATDCRNFTRVTESNITDGKKLSAGVVFFACSARVAVQHREVFKDALCLFGDEDAELTALVESGPLADGFHIATAHDPSLKEDRLGVFANRFQLAFGTQPTAASMLAYDAITVWVEAARRANSVDVSMMRAELRNRSRPFDVLTGTLTFADDHSARRPVFVSKIAGGKIERLSVHEPAAN